MVPTSFKSTFWLCIIAALVLPHTMAFCYTTGGTVAVMHKTEPRIPTSFQYHHHKEGRHNSRRQIALGLAKDNKKSESEQTKFMTAYYNDDAFGLVFLGGSLASQDAAFAGTFLTLSALAAATTTAGIWNKENDPRVPGGVAILALLLSRVVAIVLSLPEPESSFSDLPPFAIQTVVCTLSLVWSFFNWKNAQEKS